MINKLEEHFEVGVSTRVQIIDNNTQEILVDKHNAIHSRNMALVIARGLSNNPNHHIRRLALGNGGTFRDAVGNLIYRPPNDGRDGTWESRLYNETYSEIIDTKDPLFGTDIGSAEAGNIRSGGGALPADDPEGGGMTIQEIGNSTNIKCVMYLNQNEPMGQLDSVYGPDIQADPDNRDFSFDELGLYSAGAPAAASQGISSVLVGNAISTTHSRLLTDTSYRIQMTVNGVARDTTIKTALSGSGTQGEITYGDICEGINTGLWIISGDPLNNLVRFSITDRSGGVFPTIIGAQTFGLLLVESRTSGKLSNITLMCKNNASGNPDMFYVISAGACINVNVNKVDGVDGGVLNDLITPANERERLLTHLIFDPILKTQTRALKIVYDLTVTVKSSGLSNMATPKTIIQK